MQPCGENEDVLNVFDGSVTSPSMLRVRRGWLWPSKVYSSTGECTCGGSQQVLVRSWNELRRSHCNCGPRLISHFQYQSTEIYPSCTSCLFMLLFQKRARHRQYKGKLIWENAQSGFCDTGDYDATGCFSTASGYDGAMWHVAP